MHVPAAPLLRPRCAARTVAASGSSSRKHRTFQSVSPSSIIASTPSTLTAATEPVGIWRKPTSTASSGSLSPLYPASGSTSSGFSQVCAGGADAADAGEGAADGWRAV